MSTKDLIKQGQKTLIHINSLEHHRKQQKDPKTRKTQLFVSNEYKILEYGLEDGMQYVCFMMHK